MPPRQPPAQFSSLQQSNLDLYNPPPLVPCNVRIEVVSSRVCLKSMFHALFSFAQLRSACFRWLLVQILLKFFSNQTLYKSECVHTKPITSSIFSTLLPIYMKMEMWFIFPIHSFRIWKSPRLITKCRKRVELRMSHRVHSSIS